MTPLHAAAVEGHAAVIRALLDDALLDPNAVAMVRQAGGSRRGGSATFFTFFRYIQGGSTALHCAAMDGHTAAVACLLSDPRVQPNAGDQIVSTSQDNGAPAAAAPG